MPTYLPGGVEHARDIGDDPPRSSGAVGPDRPSLALCQNF